ncbi:MAG: GAF domain-containing SpoIIE family protein phosphatase [candidate division KSB1 bacterium]|nr:GAF domain-containing SpoIIE family protein phosphatase [candidate division KSB1 bacterium]
MDQDWLSLKMSDHILVISWAFFATVFILIALGTLRNLIYIKRKQSTARNFTWLMIMMVLYSVLAMPVAHESVRFGSAFWKTASLVILFIVINFIIINALRVAWVNYLNKKQKLGCFWGGFLLLPIQIYFTVRFQGVNPIYPFSPVLERFIEIGNIFLSVYLVVAFLALLAHLPTAKLFDRKLQQISSLHFLSRAVSSEFDVDKLVRTIVQLTTKVTEADFAWLELQHENDQQLRLVSSCRLDQTERDNKDVCFSDPLVQKIIRDRSTFSSNQAVKNSHSSHLRNWKHDLGSLIAVPLATGERVVGILYAGKTYEFGFEQEDGEMLRAFGDQAVIALENARLVKESLIKERLEQELKVAHDAQMKLLPIDMPTLPGIAIDAVCITANEVGGDYYDFFKLSPTKLGVIIGDVSGKGASAAFYMAEVKGIMESLARPDLSPKDMMCAANETLYQNFSRNIFISVVYAVLDSEANTFTFCRAGHCPVLFMSSEDEFCKRFEPRGLGLGLDSGKIFKSVLDEVTIPLKKGHTMMLYTDGVTESRNPDGEEFGENRLSEILQSVHRKSALEIKKQVIHAVFTFLDGERAYDDMTFVVIKDME